MWTLPQAFSDHLSLAAEIQLPSASVKKHP
jgi:hypothetical protein